MPTYPNNNTETSVHNYVDSIVVTNNEVASLKVRLESLEEDFVKLTAFVNTLAEKINK